MNDLANRCMNLKNHLRGMRRKFNHLILLLDGIAADVNSITDIKDAPVQALYDELIKRGCYQRISMFDVSDDDLISECLKRRMKMGFKAYDNLQDNLFIREYSNDQLIEEAVRRGGVVQYYSS